MGKTKIQQNDPVVRDYRLTPQFTSMRSAFTIVVMAYIILMLLHFLTGIGGLGTSVVLLCLAALPIGMYVFAYTAPFSAYRKMVSGMSGEEYDSFQKEYLEGKKYITAKPGDPCVLTITDRFTVFAANPVKIIPNSDITWAYERIFDEGGQTVSFIDIHAGSDFTTFTLENMDSGKAEEILGVISAAAPDARIGYDHQDN